MAGLELLQDFGLRIDGRRPEELRQLQCKLGIFTQADGSAFFEQGNTKILATVYGPHEIRGSKSKVLHDRAVINCQYSAATFSQVDRKRRPRGDRKSVEVTSHLKQTFSAAIKADLYPKSQIDIFVEVLQADGGVLASCINAATLALIDAGVPMKDYVCACTASLIYDIPLVDVSHGEKAGGGPELTIATLPRSGEMVYLSMTHRFHVDHLSKVMDIAIKGCEEVFKLLDEAVRTHVTKMGAAKR